ncbi:MAG: patatin-like phospholipase family protein [Candidatus Parcubacteria bacterium]|nr:patatin-like phospholipase family protein [Candidatus Parcubacteria bacterium]
MIPSKNKKVGLVLGSGSARGFVHIGIIKVLERNNIPIDFIAGSSIGALVGGIYAATKDIAYIEKLALDTDWKQLFKLLDPFSVIATDIVKGEPVIFREGNLAEAIRASVSIPFLFHTVPQGDKILCDGALSIPVPVAVAKQMGAEYTIAVDLDSGYFKQEHPKPKDNLLDTGNNVVMLLSSHLAKENMKDADLVLTPPLGDIAWRSFGSRETTADLIARGEKIMEEALPRYFETNKPKTFGKRLKEFLNQPI